MRSQIPRRLSLVEQGEAMRLAPEVGFGASGPTHGLGHELPLATDGFQQGMHVNSGHFSNPFQLSFILNKARSVTSVASSSGLVRCAMPSALDNAGRNGRMLTRRSGGGAPASCGNSAAP